MRNRPLVTDKTQPQRCQERAGLKDNTTHTPYMEFLTFFLIHNTPNEVCKQAKIEKKSRKTADLVLLKGQEGECKSGHEGGGEFFFMCPNDS